MVAASLLTALLVATAGFWLVPLRDPVEVVGCPLFQGYSERSEQLFFYLFIIVAVVTAGATTRWLRPASIRTGYGRAAPLILLLLVAAAATIWLPYGAVSSFVPLLVAWLLGSSRAIGRKPSMGLILALWLWPLSFIVIRSTRHIVVEVCRDPVALGGVLMTLAALGFVLRRQIGQAPSRARWLLSAFDRFADRHPWVTLAIWLVAAMACVYPYLRWTLLAVVLAAALGVAARSRSGSPAAWWCPEWVALVVLAAALSCSQVIPFLPSWNHLAVWLLAVVIGLFAGTRLLSGVDGPPFRLPTAGWLRWALLGLLLVPFLRYATVNLWTGTTLSLIVCTLLLRRPRSRSFVIGVLLGIAILLAVLPRVELDRSFDPPHDGQVLSAVWELENDQTLFEEVFPLRGYQLFLCLLSRQLLPPTVQGLHVAQQLVTFLHLGGICALVFAWTRSGAWSFAAAMLLLWSGYHSNSTMDLASRQGMMLWIAALMIAYLRSNRPIRWLYLLIAAVCAAASGFDSYAALLPALAAACLAGWYLAKDGSRDLKRFVVKLLPVALAAATPMVILCIWQGPQSVRWFWTLLIESSQYYNTFFGMPIELSAREAPLVFTGLLAIGVWVAAGAHLWSRMRRRKRMMWIFLLVFFVFVLHRGIGRSYWMWLQCVIQPALTMAAIAAYELISLLRRRGRRDLTTDRCVIAVAVSAVLLWNAPVSLGNPQDLVEAIWSMPEQQQLPLRVAAKPEDALIELDSYVTEHVAPDQTLWAIESGFLNFLYERHNPTRHTLAVTSWPIENARMVEAMRQEPPALIHFDHQTFEFQNLHDMPFTVRYYIVSQYLFAAYQPSAHPPYLIPVTPQWQGFDETPTWLEWPFRLQKLPGTWGELRAARLEPLSRRQLLPVGVQTVPASWTFAVDCSPRDFNYVFLRMAARSTPPDDRKASSVLLEVASPGGPFDTKSSIAFEVQADGSPSDYLVPIGCSPAWSWRRHIDRLRLSSDQEIEILSPEVELWLVDEMERYRR